MVTRLRNVWLAAAVAGLLIGGYLALNGSTRALGAGLRAFVILGVVGTALEFLLPTRSRS